MYIIGLLHKDGQIEPLAYTKNKLSNRELRKAIKQFKKDKNVSPICTNWFRLYRDSREMFKELKEY